MKMTRERPSAATLAYHDMQYGKYPAQGEALMFGVTGNWVDRVCRACGHPIGYLHYYRATRRGTFDVYCLDPKTPTQCLAEVPLEGE